MKIVSLRIFALVGLGVLLVIPPNARSDDAADWANQQAQAQKEREDWYNQQAQAQRDREQAEKDQQAREAWQNQIAKDQKERDDWYNQQAQAQKERDEWDKQQAQAQRDYEQAEKDRQEREVWQNQIAKDQQERADWYNQQAQAAKEREDWLNQQAQAQREAEQAQKERELNDYFNQLWKNSEDLQKWAADQASARQEAINRGEWGSPAAVEPSNQSVAGPLVAPAALPPPQPGAKTYTVTVYNGTQVKRTTFVMQDNGSWLPSESHGIDTVTPAAPTAGPMAALQARLPAQAIPQQASPPLDPIAFQQRVRENQERVRQRILQRGR